MSVINYQESMEDNLISGLLTSKLDDILKSLYKDMQKNEEKHQKQLEQLRMIIAQKDRKIKQLEQKINQLQEPQFKLKSNKASSSKRITLCRRSTHQVSQFISENLPQSVLAEHKFENEDNGKKQLSKNLTASYSTINYPYCQKFKGQNKQNLVLSMQKLPDRIHKKSILASKQTLNQQQNQQKSKKFEKNSSREKTEKKCINIILPVTNFCSYSIKSAKKKSQAKISQRNY